MFKNMKFYLFVFLLTTLTAFSAEEKIRSYEVRTNPWRMGQIADRFEVVKRLKAGFEVYVPEERLSEFLKFAPGARLLSKNIHYKYQQNLIVNADKYRKYVDVENDLKALASRFDNLVTLDVYGKSPDGRNLYTFRVHRKNEKNEGAAKLMITAATHGDELITTEVLFHLIEELLSGYGKDPRLTAMIDTHDIYFIPVVSPDSFDMRQRYVQGIDPNRSFPWPQNPQNKSVDVISSIINLSDKMKFQGSLDLHAYGQLVMYPWAYTTQTPAPTDVGQFDFLVKEMAKENRYKAGQISTTIYVAKGSSADYFYWKSNTVALAAELGVEKIPNYNQIPKVVNESREMIWRFIEHFR